MTLTSLSDHSDYLSASTYSDSEKWKLHRKRVGFGKQPLELWMFVPCDEDGNVLKEPHWMHRYNNGASPFMNMDEIRPCQNYKKAKERCLFEGNFQVRSTGNPYVRLNNIEFNLNGLTVERLVHYNLQLTPTAIKQLEL